MLLQGMEDTLTLLVVFIHEGNIYWACNWLDFLPSGAHRPDRSE